VSGQLTDTREQQLFVELHASIKKTDLISSKSDYNNNQLFKCCDSTQISNVVIDKPTTLCAALNQSMPIDFNG